MGHGGGEGRDKQGGFERALGCKERGGAGREKGEKNGVGPVQQGAALG